MGGPTAAGGLADPVRERRLAAGLTQGELAEAARTLVPAGGVADTALSVVSLEAQNALLN